MRILTLLACTSSKLQKERILREPMTPLERKVFVYAYSADYTYHIKFPEHKEHYNLQPPTQEMFDLLNDLLARRWPPTEAKRRVYEFMKGRGNLIALIINKDLRCGVTPTTINKVHPGLVPVFKVQLAKEVPLTKVTWPKLVQVKYDGVRIVATCRDKQVRLRTRNGFDVDIPALKAEIERIPYDNFALDGELVIDSGKSVGRTSVSGMVNSAIHGGTVEHPGLKFFVFDAMRIQHFESAACDVLYKERLSDLASLLDRAPQEIAIAAPTYLVSSLEEANELYNDLLQDGYEGIILKDEHHKYTFKRSADWIKVKEIKTVDLRCINTLPHSVRHDDIGALVCKGIVEGKRVKVNVGSGLTDYDRARSDYFYIGKTIEVKYNSVIEDQSTGEYSLFLPRFVSVRADK